LHPSTPDRRPTERLWDVIHTRVGVGVARDSRVALDCTDELIITSAEGGYVFGSVCLSVCRITEKVVNGF